jgi:hypothetical protein
MRRRRLATLWWPGLSEICGRARPWGLLVALTAAFLLDLALLASFAWTEQFSPPWRIGLWSAVVVGWGSWALVARATPLAGADESRDRETDPLAEAQEHYLKGHYLQAELTLVDMLRRNRRDIEARLMLATLLRRTHRLDEAAVQLTELARFEEAERWRFELDRERELLVALRDEGEGEEQPESELEEEDRHEASRPAA